MTKVLAIMILLTASAGQVIAADPSTTSDDLPTFVTPPRLPTEVAVGGYLIGLSRVSEPSEPFPTYDVEVFLNLAWKDPRLAHGKEGEPPHVFQEEEAEEKLSEIWSPDIEIQNEVQQRQTESVELTIQPDGSVDYEERFGATLNAEFDLRRFPFDRQILDIELQSFVWDRNQTILTINEAQTGLDPDFEVPEWQVTRVEGRTGFRSEIRDETEFSAATFRVHAKRNPGHYLLRVLVPMFFVMVLTWLAFWEPVEDRFRVGFFSLLTVVATHTLTSRSLPRLNYPTLSDVILITCYLVAAALIVTSIVVRRTHARGAETRAERIDAWVRWLLPLFAVVMIGGAALILW